MLPFFMLNSYLIDILAQVYSANLGLLFIMPWIMQK